LVSKSSYRCLCPRIASTNLPSIRAARNPGDAAVASARGPCGHRSGAKLSVAISDLLGRWGGLNSVMAWPRAMQVNHHDAKIHFCGWVDQVHRDHVLLRGNLNLLLMASRMGRGRSVTGPVEIACLAVVDRGSGATLRSKGLMLGHSLPAPDWKGTLSASRTAMPQIPSHRPTLPGLSSWVLAASLGLLPGAALAFAVRDVPNPRQSNGGWVSDVAGILRQDTETRINGMIDALQRHDGSEMMVVTVPDTSGSSSPKTYATELFNTFKIGKKGIDNGVLMLISKGDRRVEIETGYGMEERLPDARVGTIIRTSMMPRFKEGDFDGGSLAGVGDVIGLLSPEARKNLPTEGKSTAPRSYWTSGSFRNQYRSILVLSFIYLVFLLLQKLGLIPGGSGDSSSSSGDSSSSSSDSSSSSSDSGGGGSSGGGGAGDSW